MQGIGAGIAGAGPQQPQAIGPQDSEPTADVSPEEQAMYDRFIENAFQIIMGGGDQPSPAIVAQLQGQFDPELQQMLTKVEPPVNPQSQTDNLAATVVMIVLYLQGSAEQAGQPVPGYIAFEAGNDITEALAEMTGLDERSGEMAFYRACDIYRQVSPFVDQDELAQEFSQFVQAEQAGALDKAAPGLREKIAENAGG